MTDTLPPPPGWRDELSSLWWRIAASGAVPPRWFQHPLPEPEARSGRLSLEIVSHCWQYSHLLAYQLSSLVLRPPADLDLVMTVFHNPADEGTAAQLAFFGAKDVPGLRWNFQPLPRGELFRRSIGRNRAALATTCDWIWFTDCDLVFHEHCLDTLARTLQGRSERLLYPQLELVTTLLADDDPMLAAGAQPQVLDIDTTQFDRHPRTRATGPLQITHGDIARAGGYCNVIGHYQQPAANWCKAHEDRAFRWLLGTQGTPIELPGVFRIRHEHKGRYSGGQLDHNIRHTVRVTGSRLREGN